MDARHLSTTAVKRQPYVSGTPSPQARAKALRETQRARLDARHKYLLGLVAERLNVEESAVEDFMLDGDQARKKRFLGCVRTMFMATVVKF